MIGIRLQHAASGTIGRVDSTCVDPSGVPMVRVNDKWLPLTETVALPPIKKPELKVIQ